MATVTASLKVGGIRTSARPFSNSREDSMVRRSGRFVPHRWLKVRYVVSEGRPSVEMRRTLLPPLDASIKSKREGKVGVWSSAMFQCRQRCCVLQILNHCSICANVSSESVQDVKHGGVAVRSLLNDKCKRQCSRNTCSLTCQLDISRRGRLLSGGTLLD